MSSSKTKTNLYLIFSSFILLSLSLLFPHKLLAADLQLGINPPLLKVTIKPGKTITQVYKVDNFSVTDQNLVVRLVAFTKADQFGNPILDPSFEASWLRYFTLANSDIEFNKPFLLKGGSSQQLILSLAIPEDAPLKDLYLTLLVSTYDPNTTKNQGTAVKASIASNLLVTINTVPNPDTLLRVIKLTPESKTYLRLADYYFMDNITPTIFSVVVQNDGNFAAEAKGVFSIKTSQKTDVTQQKILLQYVIGQSQRKLMNDAQTDFKFTPNLNLIGRYTAQVDINNDNANTSSQIKIIFLPLKALFGLAVGLILLLSILNSTFKRQLPE